MKNIALISIKNNCRDANCSNISCEEDILKQFAQFDFFNKSKEYKKCVISIQAIQCPKKWKMLDNIFSEKRYPLKITFSEVNNLEQDILFNSSLVKLISRAKDLRLHLYCNQQEGYQYTETLFQLLQSSNNLRTMDIIFPFAWHSSPVTFEPVQSSLINLESISIKPSIMPVNQIEFYRNLADTMIDPMKTQGNLKFFRFQIQNSNLESQYLSFILRILNFNYNTLEKFEIFYLYSHNDDHLRYPEVKMIRNEQGELCCLTDMSGDNSDREEKSQYKKKQCLNTIQDCESSTELETKKKSIKIQLMEAFQDNWIQITQFLGNFQKICLDFMFSKDSAIAIGRTLGESKLLEKLQLRTKSEYLNDVLESCFSACTSITQLKVDLFTDMQVLGFKSNQILQKLKISIHFYENFSSLNHLFKEVTQMTNLKSLSIQLRTFEQYIKFENMILPICNLKHIQQLNLHIFKCADANITEENQRKMISKMILYLKYPQIKITGLSSNIQILFNEFNFAAEMEMSKLIGFYKLLAPELLFHPRRHIEDFFL